VLGSGGRFCGGNFPAAHHGGRRDIRWDFPEDISRRLSSFAEKENRIS